MYTQEIPFTKFDQEKAHLKLRYFLFFKGLKDL